MMQDNHNTDEQDQDIPLYTTKRATSENLEKVLYEPFKVLDHGFIRVIDYMGDDAAIVQAARVSYGKGTKQVSQDKGLINYLLRHKHTTPFEMCEIKFHVKLPIFIARQWIRHRTANVNEYSARYSILSKEFYIPEKQHLSPQSVINKQGREARPLSDQEAEKVLNILKEDATRCYQNYITLMNEDENGNIVDPNVTGIARELARMNLTLNQYTEWYWKIDLHNLLHFIKLRADSHAQFEIQEYANVLANIVKAWVPYTYDAFVEHVRDAITLSKTATQVLKRMLAGESVTQETSGLTKREWAEFSAVFGQNIL
jgi:thymidylate synthase (FAD)